MPHVPRQNIVVDGWDVGFVRNTGNYLLEGLILLWCLNVPHGRIARDRKIGRYGVQTDNCVAVERNML